MTNTNNNQGGANSRIITTGTAKDSTEPTQASVKTPDPKGAPVLNADQLAQKANAERSAAGPATEGTGGEESYPANPAPETPVETQSTKGEKLIAEIDKLVKGYVRSDDVAGDPVEALHAHVLSVLKAKGNKAHPLFKGKKQLTPEEKAAYQVSLNKLPKEEKKDETEE
jgi:hypothetical protein